MENKPMFILIGFAVVLKKMYLLQYKYTLGPGRRNGCYFVLSEKG